MKSQFNQQTTVVSTFSKSLWIAAVALILAGTMMLPASAAAQIITGGTAQVVNVSTLKFDLSGGAVTVNGFTLTGTIYVPGNLYGIWCNPCGSQLDITAGGSGLDFFGGDALTWVPVQTFPAISWGSMNAYRGSYLVITGPPIPITGPGVYTGSFTYTATLCGLVSGHFHVCDVYVPLQSGNGQVFVYISKNPTTGFLYTTYATYLFQ